MSEQRPYHHLFGLAWIDFFRDSDIVAQEETDLSHKHQYVDIVLVRHGAGAVPRPLPDGFEDLGGHNLLTFKSHQEALDGWALYELVGHYVNYRKQFSPSMQDLLPEDDYRLFAVCVRYPQNLARLGVLTAVRPGVYNVVVLHRTIRVIVIHQLPAQEQNAMLLLFSAKEDLVRYAASIYRPHSCQTSSLLFQLLRIYCEDPDMSSKLDEFVRQTIDEMLKELPPEKLLERLTPEERVKGLTPEGLEKLRRAVEDAQRRLQGNGSSAAPHSSN